MTFWEKPAQQKPWEQPMQSQVQLDEEVVQAMESEPQSDVFEDEEEDTQQLMQDANLRLEQGRLYQMILQNDIFGETNADPRAIRNVQREIRRFVRERMETMLGIRQEQVKEQTIVSSPFNDMEVTVLKMLASRASKGATENPAPVQQQPPQASPKKDNITAISGTVRQNVSVNKPVSSQPTVKESKPKEKAKSAISAPEGSALTKPIDQMSQEELAAHNKAAEERNSRRVSAIPQNLVPHPSPQQLEMMYRTQLANTAVSVSSMRPYRLDG